MERFEIDYKGFYGVKMNNNSLLVIYQKCGIEYSHIPVGDEKTLRKRAIECIKNI